MPPQQDQRLFNSLRHRLDFGAHVRAPDLKGGPAPKRSGGGHVGKGLMYPRTVPEAKSLPNMAAPGFGRPLDNTNR